MLIIKLYALSCQVFDRKNLQKYIYILAHTTKNDNLRQGISFYESFSAVYLKRQTAEKLMFSKPICLLSPCVSPHPTLH